MSVERIAVATAVISAAVSAASLLLAWYRGGTTRRPRMARTLGALTLVSALGLIVALAFASAGDDEIEAARPASLSADEYRLRFIGVCKEHLREAESIERAERGRPMFGVTVQLERRTTDKLQELRPPRALQADHRKAVTLWLRRVSLLDHFYGRYRREKDDPAFQRQFGEALKEVDRLSRALQKRFVALRVVPECSIFFS